VLHVHYHTYVFCCRNTERGQRQYAVLFILRHPVHTDRRPRIQHAAWRVVNEPLEDNLGRSLAEDAERILVESDHAAHRLSHRVERVDFEELFFGNLDAIVVVVEAEFKYEAKQRTLGLITDLSR